jgi:hypothetical protein
MAKTAIAGTRPNTHLRITNTSKKDKKEGQDNGKLEQAYSNSPGLRSIEETPLSTTERLGRLIRWIDYVD